MRSRSSRFFIVLLHLVGVTTHLPGESESSSQLLQPATAAQHSAATYDSITQEHTFVDMVQSSVQTLFLFWIEDEVNGVCLGPDGGFSICSDTTLWALVQRPSTLDSSSCSLHPPPQPYHEFAVQYVDWQHDSIRRQYQTETDSQCLITAAIPNAMNLAPCSTSQAWQQWTIDSAGRITMMHPNRPRPTNHGEHNHRSFSRIQQILGGPSLLYVSSLKSIGTDPYYATQTCTCYHLHRCSITNVALMSPCHFNTMTPSDTSSTSNGDSMLDHYSSLQVIKAVPFSFTPSTEVFRYKTQSFHFNDARSISSHTTSHVKADVHTEPHLHPELKHPSDLLFGRANMARPKKISTSISDVLVSGKSTDTIIRDRDAHDHSHDRIVLTQDPHPTPHKTRKIPTHPYLATAKDGIYEDPRTGLQFFTDLSTYLGYDTYTFGRQTLMGMGHYYRTLLKIKVYGVAFYVSKRDVLADPFFIPFASMTAKDLTQNDSFYKYLYSDNRKIERTLLLKMNIQITVSSMRASLEADWKLLSPEHKAALIESSFKKRDADQNMLKTIQRPDNPSHCSCGQWAPEIYKADPTCCSRGTVMSFTWLKSGDMELRIDGRVMDTFSSPGMAQGIFHEYLRGDDPISMEARNNFADGFPFVLSPLSKVKIPSMAVFHHQHLQDPMEAALESKSSWIATAINAVGNTIASVTYQQNKFLCWMDTVVTQGLNKLVQLTISLEQYREQESDRLDMIVKSLFRGESMDSMVQSSPHAFQDNIRVGHFETARHMPVPDELSSVNPRPKMKFSRRIFIITVHFYILLLLILSIPDSFPTKVIVTKKSPQLSSIDSESDNEERNEHFGDDDSINSMNSIRLDLKHFEPQVLIADMAHTESQDEVMKKPMQKALSYCL